MEDTCPLCGHILQEDTDIRIDLESGSVILDGQLIKATRKVFQILNLLIDKSPRVVSREFMMDYIYGLELDAFDEPSDEIIPIFICNARKAIKNTNYEIDTIWGKGWLFRKKVLHNGREESQQLTG